MDYIGKKISVLKKDNEISIVILASSKEKIKLNAFFLWVVAWTVCGLFMTGQLLSVPDYNLKAYLLGWLGFWAYFEFKSVKAYLWRKGGVEKIKIREGTLFIKREIAKKGKIEAYRTEFINNFRIIKLENNWIKTLSNSYWVMGGERLAFDYYGRTIKLALQLSDMEAEKLFNLIKSEIN